MEKHKRGTIRGYIGMITVDPAYRGMSIASQLVRLSVEAMRDRGADEVRPSLSTASFV